MREIELNPLVISGFSHKIGDVWVHTYLSNAYLEPDGTRVENEYQAAKTLDPTWQERIMAAPRPFGPDGAKRLGRAAPVRPDWDLIKFQVMLQLVLQKFLDHPKLAEQLLGTADDILVEDNNWHDNTWGNCYCGKPDHPECLNPGLNWLGLILMSTREFLRHTTTNRP